MLFSVSVETISISKSLIKKRIMRKNPPKDVIESRIAKRYHKLHDPIIELLQALQDAIPDGTTIGDKVTLTQLNGYIEINCNAKPVELVINDGKQEFTLKIKKLKGNNVHQ